MVWSELGLSLVGSLGFFYGLYEMGRYSVRYDLRKSKQELTETIKNLEESQLMIQI